jgi:hypothetical protein
MIVYNKDFGFSSLDIENCNTLKELKDYKYNNYQTISKLELREQDKIKSSREGNDLENEFQYIKIKKALISMRLLDKIIEHQIENIKNNIV